MSGLISSRSTAVSFSSSAFARCLRSLPLPSRSARSPSSLACAFTSRSSTTATCVSFNRSRIAARRSNWALRSAAVAWPLGCGRTSKVAESAQAPALSRTRYFPAPTRGGLRSPSVNTDFGASVGLKIRMSHTKRLTPALGSSGLSRSRSRSACSACSLSVAGFSGFSLVKARSSESPEKMSMRTTSFSFGFSLSQ